MISNIKIAIIGLGYVGLPLATEFGKKISTIGFDLDKDRIAELCSGIDRTNEISSKELSTSNELIFTGDAALLETCNVFIVCVPTPVDDSRQPNLKPLISASELAGRALSNGDTVVYESTVYPGATEEVCVPILEKISGLKFNRDFFVGYSPERINPGDKEHRLPSIVKVTSGSTPKAARFVDDLYSKIITAGTHLASSIKVAEAAKIIENTQRDVNIGLINELAIIFNKLEIDTNDVLKAAGTKWNFLNFTPGFVGGHCIGVDPYYLTHKAEAIGYHPEMILAGRRVNDGMGSYVASQTVKAMLKNDLPVNQARVLVLGLTFKENCPDLRNTGVYSLVKSLREYGALVDVNDPCASHLEAKELYGIELLEHPKKLTYDAVILAVSHKQFLEAGPALLRDYGHDRSIFHDVKSTFTISESDLRL